MTREINVSPERYVRVIVMQSCHGHLTLATFCLVPFLLFHVHHYLAKLSLEELIVPAGKFSCASVVPGICTSNAKVTCLIPCEKDSGFFSRSILKTISKHLVST